MARSHFGGDRVECGKLVLVDCSARWRRSLHSDSVMKLSIIAAKLFLYARMAGFVCSKLILWRVAFGDAPLRKSSGIEAMILARSEEVGC